MESEAWKLEDEGKKALKERLSLHQEKDTKHLNSAGRSGQASAVLEDGSLETIWRWLEDRFQA